MVRADLNQVYNGTNPGTPSQFRIRRADGTYIRVESVGVNLMDVPAVNGIVVTTRPIEEREPRSECR